MSMSRKAAYRYLDQHYYMDDQPEEVNAKLIDDLVDMNHKPWCRTHMAAIAPNYGSDCTCGLLEMEKLVKEKWDEGPEAVAKYLNGEIDWSEAK